jgi:hypothetical protein
MSKRNAVHRGFDRFGKESGGEKKSGGWYWRSDEVIAVVDLQKSQYGPKYYVNVAFWLRALGEERFPKTSNAHLWVRLGALPGVERETAECLLNLECDVPEEQRVDGLSALLATSVVPLIDRGSSLDGLRSMVDDGTFKAVDRLAQDKLGVLAG